MINKDNKEKGTTMTITDAFNDITEGLGGTPSTGKTIKGAIDALNDTLAGSDQEPGDTIEESIRKLGEHIGQGGGPLVDVPVISNDGDNWVCTKTKQEATNLYRNGCNAAIYIDDNEHIWSCSIEEDPETYDIRYVSYQGATISYSNDGTMIISE